MDSRRYQLILDESRNTSSSYWGKCIHSVDRLTEMFSEHQRPYIDQPWHVLDTKRNRVITQDEFWKIYAEAMERKYGDIVRADKEGRRP